ncbi:MAG TPA: restriction endonuclease [bacterium]|nr:restriction endonuclease [bacterium]
MAVPNYQTFFKPLLDLALDGKEHSMQEAREQIAGMMNLSEQELNELLPSGNQRVFDNRVSWAKTYLVQAKLLESPRRGYFRITQRGRELQKKNPQSINLSTLNQYSEFIDFKKPNLLKNSELLQDIETTAETPEELLLRAYEDIRHHLISEILGRIKDNSPRFFETLVVDLMVAMGYGGSRADAGQAVGSSGDEGIDGIIKEDRLGLDVVYIQAKRWEGTVGRPEIQKFVGALHGKRAKKGVFITTGKFSEDAIHYVRTIDPKVVLIDGKSLAELMIDSGLGTTTTATYQVRRIDTDYFAEE